MPHPAQIVESNPNPQDKVLEKDLNKEYMSRLSSLRVATMLESINHDRLQRGEDPVSKGYFLDACVQDAWQGFVTREAERFESKEKKA